MITKLVSLSWKKFQYDVLELVSNEEHHTTDDSAPIIAAASGSSLFSLTFFENVTMGRNELFAQTTYGVVF